MTRRKKTQHLPHPPGWVVSSECTIHGRHVEYNTELTIRGIRGRVVFRQHVVNGDHEWIDVLDANRHFRSVTLDRVKTVHRINRTRSNK